LNITAGTGMFRYETHYPSLLAFLAVSSAAQAACYADYKIERDDPALHGVALDHGRVFARGARLRPKMTPRLFG
jgi:hypothetical protein